ncbi:hypothetical protein Tco_0797587 [Tanacetum coccineum]
MYKPILRDQTLSVTRFLAFGWHLEDIHVTWAHLEKKQTRLRTCTKIHQEVLFSERGDGVTGIKRRRHDLSGDGVWILVTTSQRLRKPAFVCIAVDTSRETRVRRKDTIGHSRQPPWETRILSALLETTPNLATKATGIPSSSPRTIDQSADGKLRDLNAEESWALLEDLALYDNESWNDPRDFAKPVKAIALPQDVSMVPVTLSIAWKILNKPSLNMHPRVPTKREAERKEVEEVLSSRPVEYYLKHMINEKLIEGLVDNNRFNNSLSRAGVGKVKGKTYNVLPRGPVYEAILKKKITKKDDVGGNFKIPCSIGGLKYMNALVDQGSNVNVMPYFTYMKLTDEMPADRQTLERSLLASFASPGMGRKDKVSLRKGDGVQPMEEQKFQKASISLLLQPKEEWKMKEKSRKDMGLRV